MLFRDLDELIWDFLRLRGNNLKDRSHIGRQILAHNKENLPNN